MQGLGSGDLGRERPAFAEHDPEGETVGSISNERTFREDVTDPASIEAVLCGLCERVCWRARKRHVKARTVTLKLRYADFHTLTRSQTTMATNSELELYPIVKEMFAAARTRSLPIRLLGMQLSNLGVFEQLPLFDRTSGSAPWSTASAPASASTWSVWPPSWAGPSGPWWGGPIRRRAADRSPRRRLPLRAVPC